jgi:hypothetical protein
LHCINNPKFKANINDAKPDKPTQNIPRVTKLIKRITIQKTIENNCGSQKNNELILEITLVGFEEAKYQVYV